MARGLITLIGILAALTAARGPAAEPRPIAESAAAARPLPFFYDLYTFRGAHGATAVVAAYAVQAGDLEREYADRGVRYRFDVSLVLADTLAQRVWRRDDSVYVGMPRPLSSDHLLYTSVEVPAPPSSSTVQRVIMIDATTPGIGQLYTTPFPIPDYRGTHLMLSDVALGHPESAIGWQRGDVTLALLPSGRFPASAFDVYYEIYNLPAGSIYRTQIAVDEIEEDGAVRRRLVNLGFAGESTARDGVLPELRRVETSLPKGRYRIEVTVTDPAGQSASRYRIFEVHSPYRSATMVPAVPRTGG